MKDVQSWLTEAETAANAGVFLDKRTREQALEIVDAVMAAGAVDAKPKKVCRGEGSACDGRRKLIYPVPFVIAPKVAMAADVEPRKMHARAREVDRTVSRLTPQIDTSQPVEPALQRLTAAGSVVEKRAVNMVAGSIFRMDMKVHKQ